jgi:hypothetical protein
MKMKRTPIRGFLQDVSGFSDEQTLFFFARTPTPLHISMLYRYPFHARGTPVPHPWNAWTTLVEHLPIWLSARSGDLIFALPSQDYRIINMRIL